MLPLSLTRAEKTRTARATSTTRSSGSALTVCRASMQFQTLEEELCIILRFGSSVQMPRLLTRLPPQRWLILAGISFDKTNNYVNFIYKCFSRRLSIPRVRSISHISRHPPEAVSWILALKFSFIRLFVVWILSLRIHRTWDRSSTKRDRKSKVHLARVNPKEAE